MAEGITLLAWGNCVDNVFGLLGLAKVHSQMVWEWKNGGERLSLFVLLYFWMSRQRQVVICIDYDRFTV